MEKIPQIKRIFPKTIRRRTFLGAMNWIGGGKYWAKRKISQEYSVTALEEVHAVMYRTVPASFQTIPLLATSLENTLAFPVFGFEMGIRFDPLSRSFLIIGFVPSKSHHDPMRIWRNTGLIEESERERRETIRSNVMARNSLHELTCTLNCITYNRGHNVSNSLSANCLSAH